MPTFYHFGYRGTKIDAFLSAWEDKDNPNLRLIDVRYGFIRATSPWSQKHLREQLGDGYRHYRSLGNENYRGGPTKIHDLEKGLKALHRLLDDGKTLVFMCACENLGECHRQGVIEALWKSLSPKACTVQPFFQPKPKPPGLFD